MSKVKFLRCALCGNIFGVVNDSGVIPVCCNQPMGVLEPNTTDAAGEKHVPALERNGAKLTVKVGSVAHPMQEEHYIQWIAVAQGDRVQRVVLHPGAAPEASFTLDDAQAPVSAYEYCNLHSLWSAEG